MLKTKFNGVDTNIGAIIALTGVALSFLLPTIGFITGGLYGVKTLIAANAGAGLFLKTASAIGGALLGAAAGRIAITPVAIASTVFGAGVRYSNNLVLGSLKGIGQGLGKILRIKKNKEERRQEAHSVVSKFNKDNSAQKDFKKAQNSKNQILENKQKIPGQKNNPVL